MARTNFTFTFTNAQPGAGVTFSYPVYADGSTTTQDGPQLTLDANKAVSVWAESDYLIAVSTDGNGLHIQGTATKASPSVTVGDGTAPTNPFGSGGSSALGFGRFSATITSPSGTPVWTDAGGTTIAWHDDGSGNVVLEDPGIYTVYAGAGLDASYDQGLIFEIGGTFAGRNAESYFGPDHIVVDKGISASGVGYFPTAGGSVSCDLNYSSAPSVFTSASLELVIIRLGDFPV